MAQEHLRLEGMRWGRERPVYWWQVKELMPWYGPGMKEWERRSLLKSLGAQEKLVSSDKGLFLIQTSMECLSLGGGGGE